jgi:outer membrane protein OmpA-like peptidoglycan-associated protein
VAIPNPKPPKRVTTISGIVSAALDNQPMQVKIKIVEVDSRDSVELGSERFTGKYFSIIPNGKKYEISVKVEGYIPYSQVIEVPLENLSSDIVHNISLNEIVHRLNITISHVLPSSEIIETDPMLVGFKGLLQKEVIVNGSFPLLPYIFFDKGSSQIPSKYQQFKYGHDTKSFRENNLGSQLMQYYHILNIVGSRMKARPDVRITLVGCNDNLDRENDNIELSMSRASAIKRYLVYVWDIERHRVKVTARNLPIIPSSQTVAEGQAENRRVEIVVDVGTLLEPIYVERNELLATPEKVDFNINAISDKPMKGWTFTITQGGKVLKQFTGNKDGRSTVDWNWLNDDNLLPQSDKPIHYSGVIYTIDGDSAVSRFSEIPVKNVVLTSSSAEQHIGNKVFEKMTLLWYDFNNSNLSPHNTEILRTIFPKITPDVRVSVDGHTDIIGNNAANLSLSRNRAKVVHDILKKNRHARSYKYKGFGKNSPIYDNLLPEGRFYNRNVQVTVEKDIK